MRRFEELDQALSAWLAAERRVQEAGPAGRDAAVADARRLERAYRELDVSRQAATASRSKSDSGSHPAAA